MTAHRAYVGIGSNLGDRRANVEFAIDAVAELGAVARRSSLYRTAPWGNRRQPWFLNAVVLLETELAPRPLLDSLHAIERTAGRVRRERWGPRTLDLDLLLYDEQRIDETGLHVPHARLHERAFVLVPLAEVDARFAPMRDALDASELAGVVPAEREGLAAMPDVPTFAGERVRALAQFLAQSDAVRVRIARGDDDVVEIVAGAARAESPEPSTPHSRTETPAERVDTIKADLVGIFHSSRPSPAAGEVFDADRELGYIEALGIRTPVHSMGAGRLVAATAVDGMPVEYGQALFSIVRGA